MQIINIEKGIRDANIEISGSEEYKIIFTEDYLVFEIQNETSADIIASIYEGKTSIDNGVRIIKKGESGTLNHLVHNINAIYINGSGSGRVYIAAGNTEKNSFNKKAKGGDSGVIVNETIDSTSTNATVPTSKAVYDFAKGYTDSEIADLINGAPETLDTLGEIATAMQENHDVVEALDLAIGQKANKSDLTALETAVNSELDTKADKDNIPPAEADKIGGVKPDNTTLSVDENGTLSAQKAIDSIEIGGTNLATDMYNAWIKNAIRHNLVSDITKNNDTNSISGYNLAITATEQSTSKYESGGYVNVDNFCPIIKQHIGEKITWGCWAKASVDNFSAKIGLQRAAEYVGLLSTEWIKIYSVGTIQSNTYNFIAYRINEFWNSGETLYIKDLKIEFGNKATTWSPAIEDITNEQKSTAKLMTQISYPNNYLIYDDMDKPSAMVAIPKFYLDEVIDGAEHIVHPAFLVNGIEQNAIYISKYQNIIENNRFYSLPMKDPAVNINFDRSWTCCKNKGVGWHLMTAAEWAAIALWCRKNGTMPKGNNNYGKDISEANLPQKAIAASVGSDGKIGRVLTGSGRESWYHDGTYEGIADLNGNVWEWMSDIRLVYGELQVIPNAASGECDTSASSTDWKAINANAASYDDLFITPDDNGTTANSVKLDWVSGHWQWQGATIVTSSKDNHKATFASTTYSGLSDFCRRYIQALALGPDEAATDDYGSDYFVAVNGEPENYTLRGSAYSDGAEVGVFSLHCVLSYVARNDIIGGRSAYVNTAAQPLAMTLKLSDDLQTMGGMENFDSVQGTEKVEVANVKETMEITETENGQEEFKNDNQTNAFNAE